MAIPLAIPEPRVRQRIVTASASQLQPQDSDERRRQQQHTSDWQKRAFGYTRLIPELNYASRFYAKMLQKLRIFPAMREANDVSTPITSGPPVDLLERIQDPGGGPLTTSRLLRPHHVHRR